METVWEVLEAVFQAETLGVKDPSPMFLLLKECGMISQNAEGYWLLTEEGEMLRHHHLGPSIDAEDYEDLENRLKKASTDCKRLAATLQLVMSMVAENQKHLLITGRGPTLSLGDVVDGTLALHERGEGDWW